VYVAANPEYGFAFLDKWIGIDKVIDNIIKSNLKKNRLLKNHPKETGGLIKRI
jgi:NOL1/NOP2/fmu family ribosome biogenesis protein